MAYETNLVAIRICIKYAPFIFAVSIYTRYHLLFADTGLEPMTMG